MQNKCDKDLAKWIEWLEQMSSLIKENTVACIVCNNNTKVHFSEYIPDDKFLIITESNDNIDPSNRQIKVVSLNEEQNGEHKKS